ncbi:hypothetical protein GCK32_010967 [Trichostrongylus colubriformis]|uniref:Uncharacterized protein n=1 Tax=Trichostrongylus colubriformis TaxID=6319 RepID=A0AAN8FHU6_TRICO
MNPIDSVVVFLFGILLLVNARSVGKRQDSSNSYGDEPSLPPTLGPYLGVEANTLMAAPEEEAEPVVNALPAVPAIIVDSGYRARRQAGDNSYGDEPVMPTQMPYNAEMEATTQAALVEEEIPSVPMVSPAGPVVPVMESGY